VTGSAVQPDEFKLPGGKHCAGRKCPASEVRRVVAEKESGEIEGTRASVVEFNPGLVLAAAIHRACDIQKLKFIEPDEREWRAADRHPIGRARCEWQPATVAAG